jgi:hypothetical protein
VTKKDYTLIAKILNYWYDEHYDTGLVYLFSNELEKNNPRFDRAKFEKTCFDKDN